MLNVALNKEVYVNDYINVSGILPEYANDNIVPNGNSYNGWASWHDGSTAYLIIDLKSIHPISKIRLYNTMEGKLNGNSYTKQCDIFVSNDNSKWAKYGTMNFEKFGEWSTLNKSIACRYVKVTNFITSDGRARIGELEIFSSKYLIFQDNYFTTKSSYYNDEYVDNKLIKLKDNEFKNKAIWISNILDINVDEFSDVSYNILKIDL